jgi:predicted transcriptional regulator of viral defense system
VNVSDIERAAIDGLHFSAYCGGVTEVAKGLWMRRNDVEPEHLPALLVFSRLSKFRQPRRAGNRPDDADNRNRF